MGGRRERRPRAWGCMCVGPAVAKVAGGESLMRWSATSTSTTTTKTSSLTSTTTTSTSTSTTTTTTSSTPTSNYYFVPFLFIKLCFYFDTVFCSVFAHHPPAAASSSSCPIYSSSNPDDVEDDTHRNHESSNIHIFVYGYLQAVS